MDLIIQALILYLVIRWISRWHERRKVVTEVITSITPAKYLRDPDPAYLDNIQQRMDELLDSPTGVLLPTLDPIQYDYIPIEDEELLAVRPVYYADHHIEGILLVTSEAIVFRSDTFNDRVSWSSIAKIEFLSNGYRLHMQIGKPILYLFAEPNVNFAVTVALTHRAVYGLCSIEMTRYQPAG